MAPMCRWRSRPQHQQRTHAPQQTYSITSSARRSNEVGTERPSALAVLRLITSSNLVGCSTGRSEGLAPLRILSTALGMALEISVVHDQVLSLDPALFAYAAAQSGRKFETAQVTDPARLPLRLHMPWRNERGRSARDELPPLHLILIAA